jgi:prevent-host-death family protein
MTVTIEQAGGKLPQLIKKVSCGEEVVITQGSEPVAKLVSISGTASESKPHPKFGSGKGLLVYMAPDFDAPLEDFADYME